jgi:alpha-N-arabinofuranosidase
LCYTIPLYLFAMGLVNKAVLAASCIASVAATSVKVRSSGGNSTKHFGIDYGYGFLHEDINNSGDGGIYAELIQNRAFQFSDNYPVNTNHYQSINGASLSIQFLGQPLSDALPASMRVSSSNSTGLVGFENEGYWGMDVKQQKYTGSFWVKGAYEGSFTAALKSNLTDDVFGSVEIESKSVANDWTEHEFVLEPTEDAPNSNNTFAVTFDPKVSVIPVALTSERPRLTHNRAHPMAPLTSTSSVCSLRPTRAARTVCVSTLPRHWKS